MVWLVPLRGSSLTTTVRVGRAPNAEGVKVTVMVQLPPWPRVFGQLLVSANSLPPGGVMLEIVSGPVPVLLMTTLCGAEVVPTVTVPKARLAAVGETSGPVPTPRSETECGLPRALSEKTRKAGRRPATEGTKLTVTEQV